MKRFFKLTIAAALIAAMLTGCGGGNVPSADEGSSPEAAKDTSPPVLEADENYLFSNAADFSDTDFISCTDATECEIEYKICEMISGADVYDEAALEEIYGSGADQYTETELLEMESVNVEAEGVYLAAASATDESGNTAVLSFLFIYDATAPVISGPEGGTIQQDDVNAEPEISLEDLRITDNFDGVIDSSAAETLLERNLGADNVYTLTISCSDRAGNEAEESYTYTVEATATTTEPTTGGGSTTPATTAPTTPTTTAPTTPATTAPTTPAATTQAAGSYNTAYAQEVLNLVNQQRAANGLAALTMNAQAVAAANVRAAEIASSFSHTRPDGRNCFTALDEAGAGYMAAGENIAYGQPNPSEVVTSWMNSSGHRANILSDSFTQIGIGCYFDGNYYYWVQLFIG